MIHFSFQFLLTANTWYFNYLPSKQEIENLLALALFIQGLNWIICWVCKYIYWLVIISLIYLAYFDYGVDDE